MGERKGTKGLELWCRKMTEGYPGVKIDNMTTSWRDGLAFCAMIHHFRPDLIEFDKLNKDDIYHNNELAFRVAEHHLGIPALLEPEDMVEYEVPDRLSILTYLSQFYQAFESQRGKSGARIAPKRPQSTPDHGIVSPTSTSPPTKVQITIGRAKREPCAKCGLPVFIAERLNVGKLLYHRTCFRCARCDSQLTLANYYETENSEFCCEICPDEEKIISKKLSSEHSVLMRSMSDEEKSASLKTYSEKPDAYSTHFETALEYPVDGELKKNFTLTDAESTEFSKARSHFFKSQIEDSSDSGSEDIPPDLPQSRPPPIVNSNSGNLKTELKLVHRDSSFPSDKKDTNIVSDSVSEQTNDPFVTKDNVSSTSGTSVRARMKLFENNKEKKSDVNSYSSSKQVPFNSTRKKKATVVAIDDLEDFDNISKKDINIEDTPLDKSNNSKTHSDRVKDEGIVKQLIFDEKLDKPEDSNIELSRNSKLTSNIQLIIKANNLDVETRNEDSGISESQHEVDFAPNEEIQRTELMKTEPLLNKSQDSFIKIQDSSQEQESEPLLNKSQNSSIKIHDSSQEQEISVITIDSDKEETKLIVESEEEKSHITIESSPAMSNKDTTASVTISDDSFFSADNIVSPQTISSPDSTVGKRGYHTAYEVFSSPNNDSMPLENDEMIPSRSPSLDTVAKNAAVDKIEDVKDVAQVQDDKLYSNSGIQQIEKSSEEAVTVEKERSFTDDIKKPNKNDPLLQDSVKLVEKITSETKNNKLPLLTEQQTPSKENIVPSKEIEPEIEYKLIPRRDQTIISPSYKQENEKLDQNKSPNDKEHSKSSNKSEPEYPVVLNPFDDESEEETSAVSDSLNPFGEPDDEEVISPKPIPAARPKKKIIPSLEEREIKGTPEALSTIYTQRISYNPFEEDEEENVEEPVSRKPVPSPRQRKKLTFPMNPFESDEDDDKIVPVPTPRITKASPARPEPKARDSLSITSKGSHGGSTSSISSGSAIGSARKKKPAPRPPLPFRNSEQPGPVSLTISPNQSAAQSPNLSGAIRSRKTKRAPRPPKASTPCPDRKDISNSFPETEISPVSIDHSEASPVETAEDHIQREKDVKDEENRNRQSQNMVESPILNENDTNLPMLNKSTSGRWKRRKGQAPSRPIPQRRIIKTLPMSEIKRELETIEIQQQGLEKQGVRLEQIIREKCEGDEGSNPDDQVPIEVEDLILQLFELVNEKNELFRRQAELMYLRRQQRLEEEHADVEYQIRCLMLQPEVNKTDSDKAREEALLNRLVEIVDRRNEIIECLEMDRVREAEEDNSISSQLNLYSLKRDGEKDQPKEQEKKDKKKKHKKLTKIIHTLHKHKEKEKEKDRKVDIDKDVDETEVNSSMEKKKKKKFNIF